MPYVRDEKKVFAFNNQTRGGDSLTFCQRFTRCAVSIIDEAKEPAIRLALVMPYVDPWFGSVEPITYDVQSWDRPTDTGDPLFDKAVSDEATALAESDADMKVIDWRLAKEGDAPPVLLVHVTKKVGPDAYAVFRVAPGFRAEFLGESADQAEAEKILENPPATDIDLEDEE